MRKLRVALITYSSYTFAWQESLIQNLINSDFSEIVLDLNFEDEFKDLKYLYHNLPFFYKSYLRLDNKLFNPAPYALSKSYNKESLKNTPTYSLSGDNNLNELNESNIDIILNLTELDLKYDFVNKSKYGMWFLNHCDLEKVNLRPYGIWELLNKNPENAGVLRFIKKGMELPVTIDKTFACTDGLSYKRNINDILWQTMPLVENNIKLLAFNEELFIEKVKSNSNIYPEKDINPSFKAPSNLKTLFFILNLYGKKFYHSIKNKFYFNQWALIFLNNKKKEDPFNLKNYKTILPPKDRFWADPFLIKHNDKTYLFIEELIYKNKLGHLSVMEIDDNGNYTKPETILVKDYHLSYPFVFEENGTYYMIPETSGNNDIQLYKATEFPLKWEFERLIMNNVVAVDTTLHKEGDTYWLFTNMKNHKGGSKHVELNLFSSKSLFADQWEAHPLNPIVSDVKSARPAGKIFSSNNKLYRPSQNCSHHYGYGLNISEITELSKTKFKEKLIHAIEPNWDKSVNSTHSFNSADQLYISDIKIKRFRL
ncbi:hypothetical protein [uncultured Winogradskyella sp.]|uniref:glucosamine inositolphosphorylceramide transferase family protein n=1 Tax=uncultured Winogradskyella sp. TaxID=395353 RepID=UPI0026258B05|nr:hypothetical protein [uncultured Winogradskyella sp.]